MNPSRMVPCALLMLVPLWSGCSDAPLQTAPRPGLAISAHVQRAQGTAADSLVDSVLAEARDGSGVLRSRQTGGSYNRQTGEVQAGLEVVTGRNRKVLLRLFARGEEFYRGESVEFELVARVPQRLEVSLVPSVSVQLVSSAAQVNRADSFEVALWVRSFEALRGLQLDVTFDPDALGFLRALSPAPQLSGFEATSIAPGTVRVLWYDNAGAQRAPTFLPVRVCTLRFRACGGGCQGAQQLGVLNVESLGQTRLIHPYSASGAQVVIQ